MSIEVSCRFVMILDQKIINDHWHIIGRDCQSHHCQPQIDKVTVSNPK